MATIPGELILAQEQAVVCRHTGIADELKTALDVSGKETEGTLVLTNFRLIYVHGGETREDVPVGILSRKPTYFADVDALESIQEDAANLSLELTWVTKVTGHRRFGMDPKLVVSWRTGSGGARTSEFIQQLTGGSRKKNLNDWAPVIDRLRAGTQKVTPLPHAPDESTLEGRILRTLGDMQEKGEMTIETEVEKRYQVELEPEQVEEACQKLKEQGLIAVTTPKDEEPFYQKVSPLGEDSLDA